MAAVNTPMRHDTPFSASLHARPYDAHASVADTLPSIDFDFADLRERMALFTAKFDDFIERGRKRVLEERNAFRLSLAEMQESQRTATSSLSALTASSASHADLLARETEERAELQAAIQSLVAERDAATARRDGLLSRVKSLQQTISTRRVAASARTRHLEAQARLNGPEVRFWEQVLGLRIEGAGSERLRFVFCCVDDRDAAREASFVLDSTGKLHAVVESEPALEAEAVESVVDRLNDGGDVAGFLKGMRRLFVENLK